MNRRGGVAVKRTPRSLLCMLAYGLIKSPGNRRRAIEKLSKSELTPKQRAAFERLVPPEKK